MSTITLHNFEDVELPFLNDVLERVAQHQHVATADIYINPRIKNPHRSNPLGWIEYLVVLRYEDGGKLTIGAIQRGFNQPTEFHS